MEDPRIRILKMLEEGKISAEEAARLLESIKHRSRTNFQQQDQVHAHEQHEEVEKPGFGFQGFMQGIGSMISEVLQAIPEIVESSVHHRWTNVEQSVSADKVDRITIKMMGGDLHLQVRSTPEILISGSGVPHVVKHAERKLNVKVMGGSLSMTVPPDAPLDLKVMGGDAEIVDLQQEGTWKIMGGDASVRVKTLQNLRISLAGGDLTMWIPTNASFEVVLRPRHGESRFPWRTEREEDLVESGEVTFSQVFRERLRKIQTNHYQVGDNPTARVEIEISDGSVRFNERTPKDREGNPGV